MTQDDPLRPQVAGRPAWADAPQLVVPLLQLTPQGPGLWLVQFMFPSQHGPNAFSWVGKVFDQNALAPDNKDGETDELSAFLYEWYEDPEACVRKHFALEPPKGKVWYIARAPEIDGEAPPAATSKSLGDMGL